MATLTVTMFWVSLSAQILRETGVIQREKREPLYIDHLFTKATFFSRRILLPLFYTYNGCLSLPTSSRSGDE